MRNALVLVSMVALSACTEGSESASEPVSMRNVEMNDTVLQGPGVVLQGPGVVLQGPGVVLQGPGLVYQGISFNGPGVVLQGPGVVLQGPGVVLQGTSLSAVAVKDGVEHALAGLDFIGAEMELRLKAVVNGQQVMQDVVLRINDITQSVKQADVLLYDLSYREAGSAEWKSYCGTPGVSAIPLHNYWNVTTGDRIDDDKVVTFACTNAALAKCVQLGYRPWATTTDCTGKKKKKHCQEISLVDHHQACTRMLRADFCGDGTPHTIDGTAIDVWDALDPPLQTQFTDWPVEAEWTPEGASCVNFVRHPELGYPECFLKKGKPLKFTDCGELKDDALLVSAFDEEGDDDDDDDDDDCHGNGHGHGHGHH